jgi:hypothetical protein
MKTECCPSGGICGCVGDCTQAQHVVNKLFVEFKVNVEGLQEGFFIYGHLEVGPHWDWRRVHDSAAILSVCHVAEGKYIVSHDNA